MQFLSRKKETEAAVVSGVANPSSAPVLTVLNIFNAVKLERLIACVNALILTALVQSKSFLDELTLQYASQKCYRTTVNIMT